jgi:hypothetical protein
MLWIEQTYGKKKSKTITVAGRGAHGVVRRQGYRIF